MPVSNFFFSGDAGPFDPPGASFRPPPDGVSVSPAFSAFGCDDFSLLDLFGSNCSSRSTFLLSIPHIAPVPSPRPPFLVPYLPTPVCVRRWSFQPRASGSCFDHFFFVLCHMFSSNGSSQGPNMKTGWDLLPIVVAFFFAFFSLFLVRSWNRFFETPQLSCFFTHFCLFFPFFKFSSPFYQEVRRFFRTPLRSSLSLLCPLFFSLVRISSLEFSTSSVGTGLPFFLPCCHALDRDRIDNCLLFEFRVFFVILRLFLLLRSSFWCLVSRVSF